MTGLVYSLGGKYFCALTGKPIDDKESEYAKKISPNRPIKGERLCVQRYNKFVSIKQEEPYKDCVQRYNKFVPTKQEEPHKDRQGNWKEAWPHYVKSNGQKVCVITERPFEEIKEDSAKRLQDGVKDKEVVTPPRQKVK